MWPTTSGRGWSDNTDTDGVSTARTHAAIELDVDGAMLDVQASLWGMAPGSGTGVQIAALFDSRFVRLSDAPRQVRVSGVGTYGSDAAGVATYQTTDLVFDLALCPIRFKQAWRSGQTGVRLRPEVFVLRLASLALPRGVNTERSAHRWNIHGSLHAGTWHLFRRCGHGWCPGRRGERASAAGRVGFLGWS